MYRSIALQDSRPWWRAHPLSARTVDLSHAVVVVRSGAVPAAESTAARMFIEEVEKRTGIRLATANGSPNGHEAVIMIQTTGPAGKLTATISISTPSFPFYLLSAMMRAVLYTLSANCCGASIGRRGA